MCRWWHQYDIYLPTVYRREIFILGVLGFMKMTWTHPKIPQEVRKPLKTSKVFQNLHTIADTETVLTFPSPWVSGSVSLNVTTLPVLSIWRRNYILSFTHSFHILNWFEFTYFWKLCRVKLQPFTFFNQAWEFGLSVSRLEIKVFN